ncbi:MAG: tRNA pseudouridine(13) synthase TruD [Candidatus Bathyarchaeota archaeon]|nr:MAG: tRNA pseudouridine(13) synthase TruD [Candidatus Bathyarchaeota archaeon]
MLVPRIDKLLGIEVYATETLGVHGVIRKSVDDFVVDEVLVDGSKAEIEKAKERRVLGASHSRQRYLLCVLVKHNWDTFIAIKKIAKQLGIDQKQIHIAGIKDAKAITAQHVTIENASMEAIAKVSIKDIEIHPVGYVRDKLSPYYLLGNNFKIRIKAIKRSKSNIKKRITETARALETFGGISNFFGYQRFGTTRPITHTVGKAIVEGAFEEAAMLFLAKPSVHEHPSSRQERRELKSTQDFGQALQNFPKQLRYERLMLRHLVERPEDFVGAFRRLPTKLQALFVQAYQSYLFNRFLSERIKNGFSLKRAEVGDYLVSVERSGLPMVNTAKMASAETVAEVNELIKTGRMRIALPLIGLKQRPSQGTMGKIERQILEEEGIKTESFRIDSIPKISKRGGLRAIVAPIKSFKLNSISACADNHRGNEADLSFMLLRGSYATVLLREIMKPRNPISSGF